MLGNDIVDYSCDEKKYLNQRFLNRVLSPTEIEYLHQSSHQNAFLWSLWAAKEASFKAYQKTNLQIVFSPSQFKLEQPALQTLLNHELKYDSRHDSKQVIQLDLNYQSQHIHLRLSWPNPTTVHGVAYIGPSSQIEFIQTSITNQWDQRLEGNQSVQVRAVAKKLLQQNHITAQIKRPILKMPDYNKPGPPILISSDKHKLPHEISLSHDGQWLAVALWCCLS